MLGSYEVNIVSPEGEVFTDHAPVFDEYDRASDEASRLALQLVLLGEPATVLVRELPTGEVVVVYDVDLAVATAIIRPAGGAAASRGGQRG